MFNELFGGQILSGVVVMLTALMLSSPAAAQNTRDIADQTTKNIHHTKLVMQAPDGESSTWDHNLNSDRFDGARLIRTQYSSLATACYTVVGPVCPLRVALPQGAACACYYPTYWLAGTAW